MKYVFFIFAFTLLTQWMIPVDVSAQEFINTDPSFNKLLVDTTYMTAVMTTFEPGKKTNMHTHAAFFAYVMEGGTLDVHYEDGKVEVIELKAGDNLYSGPEPPHWTINNGKKPIKMLMVELKEHPYMGNNKMVKK